MPEPNYNRIELESAKETLMRIKKMKTIAELDEEEFAQLVLRQNLEELIRTASTMHNRFLLKMNKFHIQKIKERRALIIKRNNKRAAAKTQFISAAAIGKLLAVQGNYTKPASPGINAVLNTANNSAVDSKVFGAFEQKIKDKVAAGLSLTDALEAVQQELSAEQNLEKQAQDELNSLRDVS